MRYTINVIWNDLGDANEELGTHWAVDTTDLDWREQLPGASEFANLIEEHLRGDGEVTVETALGLLENLGYTEHAHVLQNELRRLTVATPTFQRTYNSSGLVS
jgi:hypothetical protein